MDSLYYTSIATPLGKLYLAGTERGLKRIEIGKKTDSEFLKSLPKDYSIKKSGTYFSSITKQLTEYFSCKRKHFNCKLDISEGTDFQQKVWETLQLIPYGETKSYRWVAEQIRNPKGVRAVGQANGRNPIPIIIPCHRVISADGGIGGFSCGINNKKKLLELEKSLK